MDITNFINIEREREATYQLLVSCFVLPDEGLFDVLSTFVTTFRSGDPTILQLITEMQEEMDDIEKIIIDYSQLFVGPFKLLAPPYGSIYLENQQRVMGDTTLNVLHRYQEAGLEISKDFKDAPDHIAAELEFMFYLSHNIIESLEKENYDAALKSLAKQSSFLNDHIGKWVPTFIQNISENSQTSFYKKLAQLTKTFIQHEHLSISKKIQQLSLKYSILFDEENSHAN